MCGRIVPALLEDLEKLWADAEIYAPERHMRYNVAPSAQIPIVIHGFGGSPIIMEARWGLVPHWWTRDKLPQLTFNATTEEAINNPKSMWREPLRTKRCIMPVYSWYEWNENEKVPGARKKLVNQPYRLFAPDSSILYIAGIWATFQRPDAQPLASCALMTKAAAPSVTAVHHRMPVILKPEQVDPWLNPSTPLSEVHAIIEHPREDFQFHKVSIAVNNARKDAPEMIEPLEAA